MKPPPDGGSARAAIEAAAKTRRSPRGWAVPTYTVLAALFTAGVFVQVLFAGLAFLTDQKYLELHINFAHVIEPLLLLTVLVAAIGRYWHLPWILALITFAAFQLQYVFISQMGSPVAAFHAADALLIFALGLEMTRRGAHDWMERRAASPLTQNRQIARAA